MSGIGRRGGAAGSGNYIVTINAGEFVLVHDANFAPAETGDGTFANAFSRAVALEKLFVRTEFAAPSDLDASGDVIFKYYWKPRVHPDPAEDVVWEIESAAIADGEQIDSALASKGIEVGTTKVPDDQITITTQTLSVATLGWAADDYIRLRFSRDADNVNDTLDNAGTAADDEALLYKIEIEIPRS